MQSLSATTNYLYAVQVITGSGQGLQTVLITSLRGSTLQPRPAPLKQGSSGIRDARTPRALPAPVTGNQ